MKFSFDQTSGLIIVSAAIANGDDNQFLELALDTGANLTVISAEVIKAIGLDVKNDSELHQLATGNGTIYVPQIILPKLYALGEVKENFPVFVHSLPASAKIDGVLGLDFLRNHVLNIDFKMGEITFE